MLQVIRAAGVLLLLSMFFAYLLAPAVAVVRRHIRLGRRKRPISEAAAILIVYTALFAPAAVAWDAYRDRVTAWVHVDAPRGVDRLFSGADFRAIDASLARVPLPLRTRTTVRRQVERAAAYLEQEARTTLHDLIAAAAYAAWLFVTPVVAFMLLTMAPGFGRSALRLLPHGHLRWRGEEYLRDVNSALAGYVRAQVAAGLVVGSVSVAGFSIIGVDSAVSLGVAAGILELVPGLGPFTAALIAVTRATGHVVPVVLFLASLRAIQDYVIYPRLIRRGMHLSTPAVILTLWSGAMLGGAAGVVLAIPLAGCLSVSLRHWREYREIERLLRTQQRV